MLRMARMAVLKFHLAPRTDFPSHKNQGGLGSFFDRINRIDRIGG